MILKFISDESGAVTVDWVVLSAAIVGLGIGTVAMVQNGSGDLADSIETSLRNATVTPLAFAGQESGNCDWVCAFSAFMLAEEPGFTEDEFNGSLEQLAQARIDEFDGYTDAQLQTHLAWLDYALSDPSTQPVYRAYYEAEVVVIHGILADRS